MAALCNTFAAMPAQDQELQPDMQEIKGLRLFNKG